MKKFLIVLSLLLFTGCTAEYNININDSIKESIILNNIPIDLYSDYNKRTFLAFQSDIKNIPDYATQEDYKKFELYNIEDTSKGNIKSLKLMYDFNLENFNDSGAVNTCYDTVNILTNDNVVTISTTNNFNCFNYYDELDSIKINITTDYKVIQTNSDKKSGKTYTWEIDKISAKNKPIIFVYNQDEKVFSLFDYLKNNITLTIFISAFILVTAVTIIILRIRSNRVNKI
ncbi:MAG: hypothetical protein NC181_00480 [Clostridium sp.]|nr:hypothetical protein [Clostridium sp.]MCM1443859.1 hypothetical protein [Candidatus Amulumruptor caecigallinarius]